MSKSASSLSLRSTALLPSTEDNISGSVSNIYDSIDDMSTASQNLSASAPQPTSVPRSLSEAAVAAAASSCVDMDNVYTHPSNSIMNDAPIFYQIIKPETEPSDGRSASCLQELDDGDSAALEYLKIPEHNEGEVLPNYAKLQGVFKEN